MRGWGVGVRGEGGGGKEGRREGEKEKEGEEDRGGSVRGSERREEDFPASHSYNYRDIEINITELIDTFSKRYPRCMQL